MQAEQSLFVLGTTLSAVVAGAIGAISFFTVPSLLVARSDTLMLVQWRHTYSIGQSVMPGLAALSALCSFTNAYRLYHPRLPEKAYKFAVAGAITLCIVPFTLAVIRPTNHKLFDLEHRARLRDEVDSETGGGSSSRGKGGNSESGKASESVYDERGWQRNTEARILLRKWKVLNAVRAVFPLAGALVAYDAL